MSAEADPLLVFLDSAGPMLHALLTRLTLREDVAEELLQELFIKLSRSATFARAANRPAYARRAAIHLALDWRRRRRRRPEPLRLGVDLPDGAGSSLSQLVQREELEQLLAAVGRLSSPRREVFVLRHIEQQSYEAIGELLGKTPQQVRGLCHKAVRQLQTMLGEPQPAPHSQETSHARGG